MRMFGMLRELMKRRQILLMRHAEEPTDPTDPDLSAAGRRRADRLAPYLCSEYGKPDFLIAAAANKRSARPLLTLRPLSHSIEARIDTSFKSSRNASLARALCSEPAYADKLVVVCWTHLELPAFAAALGAKPGECPDPWPEDVFDLILRFDYGKRGKLQVEKIVQPF
jgi:hypothetical protein